MCIVTDFLMGIDPNNDGRIDFEEFKVVMEAMENRMGGT